jgi:hypothetical protein
MKAKMMVLFIGIVSVCLLAAACSNSARSNGPAQSSVPGGENQTQGVNETGPNSTSAGLSGSNIAAGSTVTWGIYKGQILEWLVLEVKGGQALLITKDDIEEKDYHDVKNESVTWENCTLRQWLNNSSYGFCRTFTDAQKNSIVESKIVNEDNYEVPGGKETKDKIFLLSLREATKYFGSDRGRIAKYNDGDYWWWLRSPGDRYTNYAAYVDSGGNIYDRGFGVISVIVGVRPALWVKSAQLIQTGASLSESAPPRSTDIAAGGVISLGNYEGRPLEWQVLEVRDRQALLLTKDAIDMRAYNEEDEDMTWENCTLRQWLNSDFYNAAFTAAQKNSVVESKIVNEDSKYGTPGGNDTRDKIFLLSIDEANRYFIDVVSRTAKLNLTCAQMEDLARRLDESPIYNCTYDEALEMTTIWNGDAVDNWWLRSPGNRANLAALVISDFGSGRIFDTGGIFGLGGVSYDFVGLRPAMWVNL